MTLEELEHQIQDAVNEMVQENKALQERFSTSIDQIATLAKAAGLPDRIVACLLQEATARAVKEI